MRTHKAGSSSLQSCRSFCIRDPRLFERMKYRSFSAFLILAAFAAAASAQNFRQLGVEFEARREVKLPAGAKPRVAVVEFYHHGLINGDGTNVVVLDSRGDKPVPTRVLQLGGGDFCRIAFQPAEKSDEYEIFYGGAAPNREALPKWTAKAGLLLETRAFKHCNLNSLESVRKAFEEAEPIGAGYVEGVSHSSNPFALGQGAFFSRYSGTLHIDKGGETHFWTASQDASFLLIDGKEVVAAPGRHRPLRQAKPNVSGKVNLTPGAHSFEYYHARRGSRGDDGRRVALRTLRQETEARRDRPGTLSHKVGRYRPSRVCRCSPVASRFPISRFPHRRRLSSSRSARAAGRRRVRESHPVQPDASREDPLELRVTGSFRNNRLRPTFT